MSIPRIYRPSSSGKTEDPDKYTVGGLHPLLIGDVLKDGRYRIVHKLGFGSFSTVWLARGELKATYVAVKVARADFSPESKELDILRVLAQGEPNHPGAQFIIRLLDDFLLAGPNGEHRCYVTQVAGRRLTRHHEDGVDQVMPPRLLAYQLVQGIEYLHARNVAHGDLYTSNILLQLTNFDSWSDDEIYNCMGYPFKEKVRRLDSGPLDDTVPSYTVKPGDLLSLEQRIVIPKALIIDFGQAFYLHESPGRITTPAQFSSPEVLYRTKVTPAIDKWSLGCTVFEICSGYSLFKMIFNPRIDVLKDMVAMLGKPPEAMWQLWDERQKYFNADGTPKKAVGRQIEVSRYPLLNRVQDIGKMYQELAYGTDGDPRLLTRSPEADDAKLTSVEQTHLYDLLSKMMIYDPERRLTLEAAMQHPFFEGVATS